LIRPVSFSEESNHFYGKNIGLRASGMVTTSLPQIWGKQFHCLAWYQKDTSKWSQAYCNHCLIEFHPCYGHFGLLHTSKSACSLHTLKPLRTSTTYTHQGYAELQKNNRVAQSNTFWNKTP
jgi:hypothetical protein